MKNFNLPQHLYSEKIYLDRGDISTFAEISLHTEEEIPILYIEWIQSAIESQGNGTLLFNAIIERAQQLLEIHGYRALKIILEPEYNSKGFYMKVFDYLHLNYWYAESPFNFGVRCYEILIPNDLEYVEH